MQKISIDSKYTKTYKTVENLEKALEKLENDITRTNCGATDNQLRYVLCEVDGRFTAVFVNVSKVEGGLFLAFIAQRGFKCVA
jgi:hypothetical protein